MKSTMKSQDQLQAKSILGKFDLHVKNAMFFETENNLVFLEACNEFRGKIEKITDGNNANPDQSSDDRLHNKSRKSRSKI